MQKWILQNQKTTVELSGISGYTFLSIDSAASHATRNPFLETRDPVIGLYQSGEGGHEN